MLHDLDGILGETFPRRMQIVLDRRQADIHLVGKRHLRDRHILQAALQKTADDIVLLLFRTRQADGPALAL